VFVRACVRACVCVREHESSKCVYSWLNVVTYALLHVHMHAR